MKLQDLFEINMSPSALKSFSSTPDAQKTVVGFELELIVPGLEDTNGHNSGKNLSKDIAFPTDPGWENKIVEWYNNGSSRSSPTWVSRQFNSFKKGYTDYIDGVASKYMSTAAGIKKINKKIDKFLKSINQDKDTASKEVINQIHKKLSDNLLTELYKSPIQLEKFLKKMNIIYMSDFCEVFVLKYPYQFKYTPTITYKKLSQKFMKDTKLPADSTSIYSNTPFKGEWLFKPDSSIIDPNKLGAGVELVSSPIDFEQGMNELGIVWDWAKSLNITTNSSTGFHVGVSIPGATHTDYVKLILFLGDNHILKTFDRLNNEYTQSMFDHIHMRARYTQIPDSFINLMKSGINKLAKSILFRGFASVNSRYVTVNVHTDYVEFRSMGGDYLNKKDLIFNTIYRYVKAMTIANDPDAEKEEYAKKLYKMISINSELNNGSNDDNVNVFVQYAAGQLTKNQVKSILRTSANIRKNNKTQKS